MTMEDFQERGSAARAALGIDGTAGDAQDVVHLYDEDLPTGCCVVCGLSPAARQHQRAALRQRYASALAERFPSATYPPLSEIAEVCAAVDRGEMAALRQEVEQGDRAISDLNTNVTLLEKRAAGWRQRAEQAEAERDQLRERAELAETAITNCIVGIKTKMNLSMEPPANPSEWQRGWWACVESVLASFDAPYANAALELFKSGDWERSDLITAMARALVARAEIGIEAVALVRELYDDTPCDHFDHHGQCQTHSGGDPCPDGLAQVFLAALDEPEAHQ